MLVPDALISLTYSLHTLSPECLQQLQPRPFTGNTLLASPSLALLAHFLFSDTAHHWMHHPIYVQTQVEPTPKIQNNYPSNLVWSLSSEVYSPNWLFIPFDCVWVVGPYTVNDDLIIIVNQFVSGGLTVSFHFFFTTTLCWAEKCFFSPLCSDILNLLSILVNISFVFSWLS